MRAPNSSPSLLWISSQDGKLSDSRQHTWTYTHFKQGFPIDLDDIKRYEVTEVYSEPDALVDIILVHGLNGHPRNTWTTPASKKSKRDVFWPTELLPATLKSAKARVLVYGYNADVFAFNGSASSDMIHQHAQTLLANFAAERKLEERSEVPILWVAHSLGGILVKRVQLPNHSSSNKICY